MLHISALLERLRQKDPTKKAQREHIVALLKEKTDITIPVSECRIDKGILYISCSSLERQAIYLKSTEILSMLPKKFPDLVIREIRFY